MAEGGMWGNYASFHWKWGPGERKRTLQPVHVVFWFVSIEMWGPKSLNNMLPIIETPLKPLTVFLWFPSYMQKATYFFNVCFGTLDLDHWDVRVKPHKLVLPKVMFLFNSNMTLRLEWTEVLASPLSKGLNGRFYFFFFTYKPCNTPTACWSLVIITIHFGGNSLTKLCQYAASHSLHNINLRYLKCWKYKER